MRTNLRICLAPLAVALVLALARSAWCAPHYKILHNFGSGDDGAGLWSSMVFDVAGNLYGTTSGGGTHYDGTVFELSPQPDGEWKEVVLYNFCSQGGSDCTDGAAAFGGVTLDPSGNLYGTTQVGGANDLGTVYELTAQGGLWTEAVIHSFQAGGCCPSSAPIMDRAGNLYGTAGDAYELSPGSDGWSYGVLHVFCIGNDGCDAYAGVIRDPVGNLYGDTQHGGNSKNCGDGCGTTYRLHPKLDGTWQETILHDFGAPGDGAFPAGALFRDAVGNLYGTTPGNDAGTVYRLTPDKRGTWKETILHRFHAGSGGNNPVASVVMDKLGNLYGITEAGGSGNCGCGVVFKVAPNGNGKWKYIVLHSFTGSDGEQPGASLILDSKGNLYGTTILGGTSGGGVAFELTP